MSAPTVGEQKVLALLAYTRKELRNVCALLAEAQTVAERDAEVIATLRRELQRTKDLLEVKEADLQAARWAST